MIEGVKMDKKRLLKEAFKGVNFMTPNIIGQNCFEVKNGKEGGLFLWELSHGTGFKGENIYGVTVVVAVKKGNEYKIKGTDHELSKLFLKKSEAIRYIEKLQAEFGCE